MGSLVKTPMTRSEACQILSIELSEAEEASTEPVDHNQVMEVSRLFNILMKF